MLTKFQALRRMIRRSLELPMDLRVIAVARAYQLAAEARGLHPMRRDASGLEDRCPECRKVTIHTIWEADAYVCYFCLLRRHGPVYRHALEMLEDGRHVAFLYRTMLEIRNDADMRAAFQAMRDSKARLSRFMRGQIDQLQDASAIAS